MSMAEDTRKRTEYSGDYSSSPAREPANDPLAELARLIGQSDPFTDLKGRSSARNPLDNLRAGDRPAPEERRSAPEARSAPEWLARPAPPADRQDDHDQADHYADEPSEAPHDDYRADSYETQEDEEDDGYAPQDHYDAARAQPAYNGRRAPVGEAYDVGGGNPYRVALPAADDYDDDGYYAEDGHMPPHEDGAVAPRKRGGLVTIAAVLGLAVIGTAGAFGYRAFTSGSVSGGPPPVIRADTTPAKTVPPAPAANVDAQGKPFQDRIAALSAPERVVPREEQPVTLPVATPSMTAPRQSGQAAAPLTAPAPPANANEPKRVRTMTIRPDGSDATASAPTQAPPPSASAPTRSIAPSGPMAIAPQPQPQSDPSSRTKVAARTPPAVAAGGAYVVQVSAQKTEAEALSSYQSMQTKYPNVLGNRNANIRRADLGDKGVYFRAQIGPFATSEQANTFCTSLKDAGGQCIVQKN
jgi:hypothetical protein